MIKVVVLNKGNNIRVGLLRLQGPNPNAKGFGFLVFRLFMKLLTVP